MNSKSLETFDKEEIKVVVLAALDRFADFRVNFESQHAREAIAVKITSDILESFSPSAITPEDVFSKK